MADLLQQLEHAVTAALKTLEVEDVQVQVQEVPPGKPGDFGTPVAFGLAKVLRRPPVHIAQALLAALNAAGLPEGIARADAVGPYLNFHVDPGPTWAGWWAVSRRPPPRASRWWSSTPR